MSKLTVVYLKDAGHVLAALTRADPPAGDEPVSALIGAGLPVSAIAGTPAPVTLPAQYLAAVTVDDDQPPTPGGLDVLINPQNFQVVLDPQGQRPPKVQDVGGGQVDLKITTSGATVTVTNVTSATSLPAVVVLQKVPSPSPPATGPPNLLSPVTNVLSPVTVTVGGGTVVSGSTGFAQGDTWNMFAFVQGLPPTASGTKTL
jgi:hypothetical protein